MADFEVAYNWMMDNEDAGRNYATVPDTGGEAISGINSAAYPMDFARIDAVSQAERGVYVGHFYQLAFWNKWYEQLTSDEVAKRVFDAAVNMGPETACKLVQEAAGAVPDGTWGPDTVAAINKCDPANLVTAFRQDRISHYQRIVAANPADAKYLAAWTARASK